MTLKFVLPTVLLAVGIGASAQVAHAAAPTVVCGATITANAYLSQDLSCPGGNGLTLDGNVTFDLRGHRLIGPGKSAPSSGGSQAITVTQNGTARITNGTISGWVGGVSPVEIGDVTTTAVSRVNFVDVGEAISVFNSRFTISDSRFVNVNYGVSGLYATVTITRSKFDGSQVGVNLGGGGSATIDRSVISNFATAFQCSEVGCNVSRSVLRHNTTGVSAWYAGGKISDTVISGSRVGFTSQWDGGGYISHELTRTVFSHNQTAVLVTFMGTANVHDSVFSDNGIGVSMPDNAGYAQSVTRVERNVFLHNRDGVYIRAPVSSIGHNVAIGNRRWGIYAVGATDLGGNVAYGNGVKAQCYGVVCAKH